MLQTVADLLQRVGAAGGPAVWLPLLFWTLAALPLYGLLRAWRSLHPLTQYGAHVALILALPVTFALIPLLPAPAVEAPVAVSSFLGFTDGPAEAAPAPLALPSEPPPVRWGLQHLLGVLTAAAAGLALLCLLQLLHQAYALYRYRRALRPLADRRAQEAAQELARRLGLRRPVTLLLGEAGSVPMTFGLLPPVIVLPAALTEDPAALRMTLQHELIHVRRRDYLLDCVERFVASLFAIHPLVWLLRRGAEHFRETSCDAELLTGRDVAPSAYARLLLRFHQHSTPACASTLPIARPTSNLKQRIHAMKQFRHAPLHTRQRRASLSAAAGLLLGAALFSACITKVSNNDAPGGAFIQPAQSPRAAQLGTELKRLEIQMQYLRDQIEAASADTEKALAESPLDFELTQQRIDLLRSMYAQRLEAFETLKMEQLTLAELGEGELLAERVRAEPEEHLAAVEAELGRLQEKLQKTMADAEMDRLMQEQQEQQEQQAQLALLDKERQAFVLHQRQLALQQRQNAPNVYQHVDQMPEPLPSLQEALSDLQKQIRYPEIARKAGVEGEVLVEFVVDEQGRVIQPHIKQGIGAGCDEEALRVVQTLSFRPGRQDGEPVSVRMVLPITFRLPA